LIKKENVILKNYEEVYENNERKFIAHEEQLGDQSITEDEMGKISVNYEVPKWAEGKMMYHIFVDRFFRGSKEDMVEMPRRHIHQSWNEEIMLNPDEEGIWNNDFYGGDLQGIIAKLDYLKSLGIDIIYLSPIVYSQSTHRYDASDYELVDPYAGCLGDLEKLCQEAHQKGMKIVLDAVFNHTGSDSKYFNKFHNPDWEKEDGLGAYYDDKAKYANFYVKSYNENKHTWDFSYWWGMDTLPKCNGYSEAWQQYILGEGGIIDKWFSYGIDGLRLDVVDELTDEFIEKIRVAVKRNKEDGFIIGEVWENAMYKDNRSYLKAGRGLDSVMNYELMAPLIKYFRYGDVSELAWKIREIQNSYPEGAINAGMNFTSTHDITRGINLWDKEIFGGRWPWDLKDNTQFNCKQYQMSPEQRVIAKEIYKAYVFTLTFMPGILSAFYGDEVGIEGIGNLENRKSFPWGKGDKELLEFFRYMGMIRKKEKFMEDAPLKIRDININYLAFERIHENDSLFVLVNRTNQEVPVIIPCDYQEVNPVYTLKKNRVGSLSPYGGVALRIK